MQEHMLLHTRPGFIYKIIQGRTVSKNIKPFRGLIPAEYHLTQGGRNIPVVNELFPSIYYFIFFYFFSD